MPTKMYTHVLKSTLWIYIAIHNYMYMCILVNHIQDDSDTYMAMTHVPTGHHTHAQDTDSSS